MAIKNCVSMGRASIVARKHGSGQGTARIMKYPTSNSLKEKDLLGFKVVAMPLAFLTSNSNASFEHFGRLKAYSETNAALVVIFQVQTRFQEVER